MKLFRDEPGYCNHRNICYDFTIAGQERVNVVTLFLFIYLNIDYAGMFLDILVFVGPRKYFLLGTNVRDKK